MDKIKPILQIIQKHHFWMLCVIVMIAGLVGWYMGRKKLSAAYEQNKGTIVGKFGTLQGILSTEKPPNATWTEAIGKLTASEKELVRKAWEKVYDEQKKHLEWPPELGDQFLNFVNNNPPEAVIPRDLCAVYQDLIVKSEFPRLLAIVDARSHSIVKKAPDPKDKKQAAAANDEPKVVWDSQSQQDVEKMLDFPTTPNSPEVRQAQEDIWVYKALLNIIRAMNQDSYIARVPRIMEISIGQKGAPAFQAGMTGQHIEHLKSATAAAATEAAPPAPAPVETGEKVEKPLDEGRYLEADGKTMPPGQAATKQFKRMPIFMRLTIDQREINRLLVECANSPLPVEVCQLRINSSKQSGSKSSTSSGQAATPAHGNASTPSESESFQVPIEVAGIIYIYNPPDKTKLGGGEPGAAAPAAAAGQ